MEEETTTDTTTKGSWTRPLAWLNVPKATTDRAAEPPLSPMAPVDLDDDATVTAVLTLAIDIADVLLSSGEGAADVTLQVKSVVAAFGLASATVEVTFTSVMVGVNRRRGRPPLTVMRVINYRTVDMTRVTHINRLVSRIVRRRLTVDQALEQVEQIVRAPHPHSFRMAVFGWALLGAAVVIQLGGSPIAGLLSMVSTIALMYVNRALDLRQLPVFFQQVVGGFIASGWAVLMWLLLSRYVDGLLPSQMVAAGIIVLLAGMTLVGSIEDAITGFPVTAAGRGIETLINTGGVLGGISIALTVLSTLGVQAPTIDPEIVGLTPVWITILASGVGAAGFALASYATPRSIVLALAVAALGMGVYGLIESMGLGVVVASGAAATVVGLVGGILARVFVLPPLVITLAGIVPFLPGLSLYRGLSAITENSPVVGLTQMFQAIAIAVALASGVVVGEWLTRNLRRTDAAKPEWRPGMRNWWTRTTQIARRETTAAGGQFARTGNRIGQVLRRPRYPE